MEKRKYTKKRAVVFLLAAAMSVWMLSGIAWANEEGDMADAGTAGNSPGELENAAVTGVSETVMPPDAGADENADSNSDGELGEGGSSGVDTPADTNVENGETGETPDTDGTPDTDETTDTDGTPNTDGTPDTEGTSGTEGSGQLPGGENGDSGQMPGGGMGLPSYLEPTQKLDKLELAKREPVTLSKVSVKAISFTPQTGDEDGAQAGVWIGVMAVAALAAAVVILVWKKRRRF